MDLPFRNGGEVRQKLLDSVTFLKAVKKILDGNARPLKYGEPSQNLGVTADDGIHTPSIELTVSPLARDERSSQVA